MDGKGEGARGLFLSIDLKSHMVCLVSIKKYLSKTGNGGYSRTGAVKIMHCQKVGLDCTLW